MLRSKSVMWISTALLTVVVQGIVPAEAVAQPPTQTRELDSPIRGDRFTQRVVVEFPANGFVGVKTLTPTIPDGKKLLLQSVSMLTLLTHGESLMQAAVSIFANPSGRLALATFYVDTDFQAVETDGTFASSQRRFIGNRDINMVLNAGETIQLFLHRNGNSAGNNFSLVSLLGFLVDAEP